MKFIHNDLGHRKRDEIVEVKLTNGASVPWHVNAARWMRASNRAVAVWFSGRVSNPARGCATKGKLNFSRRRTNPLRREAMPLIWRTSWINDITAVNSFIALVV